MLDLGLLRDIVIIIAVSVPLGIAFARAGLPTIVGFLLAGVVIGPSGLGLVAGAHTVEVLAEVGVVLLLFTIGLEFSATKLLRIRRAALVGGGLQVFVTTLVVMGIAYALGLSSEVALLLGFIVSLSSTAIALKLLLDSGDINTPHGNFSVAVLLFQDIAVVLMVIVVQALGSGEGLSVFALAKGLGTAVAAVAGIVLVASLVLPKLFYHVVKLRNREVFILTIVLVCLGTALVTAFFGLSLALGAFIAGFVISESEYADQIVADVVPFKETFASLFFISIGMLIDITYLASHAPVTVGLTLAVIAAKALIVVAIGQALRQPLRLSILAGLGIAQIGEFSFILIKMGEGYGMLDEGLYQTLLAVSVLTMAATPFVFKASPATAFAIGRMRGARGVRRIHAGEGDEHGEHGKVALSNHVLILGYGLSGRHLASVLKKTGIEHVVVDVAADKVEEAKKAGHRAFFSDASHPEALKKFGAERAKIVVVGIDDPISARRIVKTAREMNQAATIIVKTRFLREVEDLKKLGASQVIPEEYETSVEIFSRVLRGYGIPTNIIENQIALMREEGYAMLRTPYMEKETLSKLTRVLEATTMDTFYVGEENACAGMALRELDLRRKTGTTVIAIVRQGKAITSPDPEEIVTAGDILVLLGGHADLHAAMETLKAPGCRLS